MKFDFEQLKNEITLSTSQGFVVKEHAYEYLFSKVLLLTEDFLADRETSQSNQLRLLSEKLKTAESESFRYKQELSTEKEQCFSRIQEGESERIKYKTENAILQERYQNAKVEIDELRMKLNCEYSEKLQDLEMQVKIQRDELRKKDAEIMELTSDTMKSSNEHNKK